MKVEPSICSGCDYFRWVSSYKPYCVITEQRRFLATTYCDSSYPAKDAVPDECPKMLELILKEASDAEH
jgi:hypothetical protein